MDELGPSGARHETLEIPLRSDNTLLLSQTNTHTHTHTHTLSLSHTHTQTHTHTHTHTVSLTHTHRRTNQHMYQHTPWEHQHTIRLKTASRSFSLASCHCHGIRGHVCRQAAPVEP